MIPHPDIIERQRRDSGVMIGFGSKLRMGTQHGRENSHLKPAGIELLIRRILGIYSESTHVGTHISQPRQTRGEHERHLRLQTLPTAGDISRPGEYGIALQTGCASTHHQHGALIREIAAQTLVDSLRPFVAIIIMIGGSGLAVGMHDGEGMHFRLAEVAPPSGHTFGRKGGEAFPEPFAGSGIGHVEHSGVTYPCGHIVHLSVGILREESFPGKKIVIVDSSFLVDIGLMDKHSVDSHASQGIEHRAMLGELLLIPFEAPHVGLSAIPIEVEHYPVEGIAASLEGVYGSECLLAVVIAIFGGDISQGPYRGKILTSSEGGIAGSSAFQSAVAVDEVVGKGIFPFGIECECLPHIECGRGRIIEQDTVAGVGGHIRDRYSCLGYAGVAGSVAVVGTVVEGEGASVEA